MCLQFVRLALSIVDILCDLEDGLIEQDGLLIVVKLELNILTFLLDELLQVLLDNFLRLLADGI